MWYKKSELAFKNKYYWSTLYLMYGLTSGGFFLYSIFFSHESINIAERITIYFNSFKIYGVWLLFNMGLSIYISVVIMIGKSLSKITIWFVYLLIITGIILFIWSFFEAEASSPLGALLTIVPFSIAHFYMLKYLKYYQISTSINKNN